MAKGALIPLSALTTRPEDARFRSDEVAVDAARMVMVGRVLRVARFSLAATVVLSPYSSSTSTSTAGGR